MRSWRAVGLVVFAAGVGLGSVAGLLVALRVSDALVAELRERREMERRQALAMARRQVRGGRPLAGADRIGVN